MPGYRPSRHGRRRGTGNTVLMNVLSAIALVIVFACGALAVTSFRGEIGLDAPERLANGCLAAPSAATVVAIDGTGRFSEDQWRAASGLVEAEYARLEPDAALVVHVLQPASELDAVEAVRTCAPAAASDNLGGPTGAYRRKQLERARDDLAHVMAGLERPVLPGSDPASGLAGLVEEPGFQALSDHARVRLVVYGNFVGQPPAATAPDDLRGLEVELVVARRDDIDIEINQDGRVDEWAAHLEGRGAVLAGRPWTRVATGEPPARDSGGCLARPSYVADFLVDMTDPYTESQWRTVHALIVDAFRALPADGVLRVLPIAGQAPVTQPRPSQAYCAPPTGTVDAVRENQAQAIANRLLLELPMPTEAARSPIMEHVSAVVQDRRLPLQKLILASDMLFNSKATMLHWKNGVDSFAEAMKTTDIRRFLADLREVELKVHYFRRDSLGFGELQNPEHMGFIHDWANAQGAEFEISEIPES